MRRSALAVIAAAAAAAALLLAPGASADAVDGYTGCGVGYPLQEAGWSGTAPPFIRPAGCTLRVHPRARLQRCLGNRTLYIIGNSIGRNYQAELAELVGGASPFRPDVARRRRQRRRQLAASGQQPQQRGAPADAAAAAAAAARSLRLRGDAAGLSVGHTQHKHGGSGGGGKSPAAALAAMRHRLKLRRRAQKVLCGNSCETTCRGGFRIKYARVQYFGGWPKAFPRFGDVCAQRGTSADCLGDFFADSKPGDALVVQMGLMYGITHLLDRGVQRAWTMERLQQRVEADVAAFPDVVSAVFKGSTVYFATTGPASPGKWTRVNPYVRWFNPMAVAALGPGGAGYRVLDQHAISAPRSATSLYDDFVHISGSLTQATLHILMDDLCGGSAWDAAWAPADSVADDSEDADGASEEPGGVDGADGDADGEQEQEQGAI